MKPIEGYENLTDAERRLFIQTHQKHLLSLSSKDRERYGLGSIAEVKLVLNRTLSRFVFPMESSRNSQLKGSCTD